MPTASQHMLPLKDAIRGRLIPVLTKHELSNMEMEMVSLPTRFEGLSFVDPVADSPEKFADSVQCTASLTALLCVNRESELPHGVLPDRAAATAVRRSRESRLKEKADAIQSCLLEPQRRAMELAREKGGSSTLFHLLRGKVRFSRSRRLALWLASGLYAFILSLWWYVQC